MSEREALSSPAARMLHRWFVQYNPLYLVSAALVLLGLFLLSDGLARSAAPYADVWLTGVTELYQWMLIGSAALLYARGLRRPAVMLALIEVVYLGDLTFQTSVAPYFGSAGVASSFAWLCGTVLKLGALLRALRLRLSPAAVCTLLLGGGGLAGLPYLVYGAGDRDLHAVGVAIAFWLFSLAAVGRCAGRAVRSRDQLDPWGRKVLARSERASWAIWMVLATGHGLRWSTALDAPSTVIILFAALAGLSLWIRRERRLWLALSAGLAGTLLCWGPALSACALFAALALLVHLVIGGWSDDSHPAMEAPAPQRLPANPYRVSALPQIAATTAARRVSSLPLARCGRSQRLLAGALACLYVGLSSIGWSGVGVPHHSVGIDLAFSVVALLFAWRSRRWLATAGALVLLYADLAWDSGLLRLPSGPLAWGATVLTLGFAALLAGVLVSWSASGSAPARSPRDTSSRPTM